MYKLYTYMSLEYLDVYRICLFGFRLIRKYYAYFDVHYRTNKRIIIKIIILTF